MNPQSGPQLRGLHLPSDPSWWPPALGWWLLSIAVLIAMYFAFRAFAGLLKKRRHRKSVCDALERIAQQYAGDADAVQLAAALSQFLRRMVLAVDPQAAALVGDAWLAYLDTHIGGNEFMCGTGRVLLDAPYRASSEFDPQALLGLVRLSMQRFLRKERVYA